MGRAHRITLRLNEADRAFLDARRIRVPDSAGQWRPEHDTEVVERLAGLAPRVSGARVSLKDAYLALVALPRAAWWRLLLLQPHRDLTLLRDAKRLMREAPDRAVEEISLRLCQTCGPGGERPTGRDRALLIDGARRAAEATWPVEEAIERATE